jgi:hypothetical protein
MTSLAQDALARITLEPLVESVSRDTFTGTPQVVCDAYVASIETFGTLTPWGWVHGESENIDHHAPHAAFETQLSSANLALRRVYTRGAVGPDVPVRITHTDCDSILSAGVVSGVLSADLVFGEAAIAADHTGAAHPIADLLQAIENTRSLEVSFGALEAYLAGQTLPEFADRALIARLARREAAAAAVRAGRFSMEAGIAYADFDTAMEGEFFPALLPDARVIVTSGPHPDEPSLRQIRVRLGRGARDAETLHALGIAKFDTAYGGRWNAGSNRRGGGTTLSAAEWVAGYRRDFDRHERGLR